MEILVISLVSASARRARASEQLARAGLRFSFLDAIDGRAHPLPCGLRVESSRYRILTRRRPVPGEVGCYASHREAWKLCAGLGQPMVVLEDDFELTANLAAALDTVEELTRKYGFVRLESLYRPPRRRSLRPKVPVHRVCDRGGLTLYYVADVPTSLVAYAVSPRAAAALFHASGSIRAPVDRFVQRVWYHGVPVFGIEPPLAKAGVHSANSTIGERPRSRNPLLLALRGLDSVISGARRRRFNRHHVASLAGSGLPAVPRRQRSDAGVPSEPA